MCDIYRVHVERGRLRAEETNGKKEEGKARQAEENRHQEDDQKTNVPAMMLPVFRHNVFWFLRRVVTVEDRGISLNLKFLNSPNVCDLIGTDMNMKARRSGVSTQSSPAE